MMKRFIFFICLLCLFVHSQEKETNEKGEKKSFLRDRVYFSFGGEMLFLTMGSGEYNNYYRHYTKSSSAFIEKDFNVIGGGGYVGGSYVAMNHLSVGGLLSIYSVPGVDVKEISFTPNGTSINKLTHVKRNYFTFGHELEAFVFPYQKTPFNIGFLLYTGFAFLLETRGIRVNDAFVETKNVFGGTSFVLAPSFRLHIRMNKQGEVQIGYRHVMMIDNFFFHFGTIYFGLSYTVEFQKQEEKDNEFKERMKRMKKKNV